MGSKFDEYMEKLRFKQYYIKDNDIISYENKDRIQEIRFSNKNKVISFYGNVNTFRYKELLLLVEKCKELGYDKED